MYARLETHTYVRQWPLGASGVVALMCAVAMSLLFAFATQGQVPVAYSQTVDPADVGMVGRSLPTSFGAVALLPLRASITEGLLQPQASIDDEIDFLVPRDASELWMKFVELGSRKPVLIDLGRIDPLHRDTRAPPAP